ncbi:MAG: D-alanine--D-alanine ligase [Magnetococcus sp. DMHC-1]|nr:D-alanine--D-alanine ligase [Magnetococcales bacterium]
MNMEWQGRKIGVLMGGISAEREVSLRSGRAMTAALERLGHRVVAIDAGRDLATLLVREGIQVAVLALHGPLGEDGTVQGLLEVMGIPYSGSGVAASAVCMNKSLTKCLFRDAGVPTPPGEEIILTASGGDPEAAAARVKSTPPWYVKPANSGSSVGVTRVTERSQLAGALLQAAKTDDLPADGVARILVETAIVGKELTISILDDQPLPPIEIHPVSGFYDYTNKYTAGRTEYRIPPQNVSALALERARDAALAAYRVAGCCGLARVDIMLDRDELPWVLEINTVPGMTELSLAPKAAAAMGMSFDQLVARILRSAALKSCGPVY